jgi:hypothetical protein
MPHIPALTGTPWLVAARSAVKGVHTLFCAPDNNIRAEIKPSRNSGERVNAMVIDQGGLSI